MPDDNSPLKTDEHLVALRGMWDEMKLLNRKIDAVRTDLSSRIDQTNERIDTLRRGWIGGQKRKGIFERVLSATPTTTTSPT